jgi:hypothetical protein
MPIAENYRAPMHNRFMTNIHSVYLSRVCPVRIPAPPTPALKSMISTGYS